MHKLLRARPALFAASVFVCAVCLVSPIAAAQVISFDPRGGGQLTPPPSNTPPEKRCVLSGHVTNSLSGEPVKKVAIRLMARNANGGRTGARPGSGSAGQGYATASAADGSFQIEGIEPGQYTLSAQKGGFLPVNYGAKGPMQMGTILTLSPGQQLTGISLALSPQSVVSGKVVDPDGDPVDGGNVQALAQSWWRGKKRYMPHGSWQINDLGEYRVANLPPGKYYFCVQPFPAGRMGPELTPPPGKPDIRLVRTCFPSAISLANATPIELRAGQDAPGTNIQVQEAQTYHVRGRLLGTLPAGAYERSAVSLFPRDDLGVFFFNGQGYLKPDGSFDVAGVAPGAYILTVLRMQGEVRVLGRLNVDVGSGDVNGVDLPLAAPGSMHGRMRIEGNAAGNSSVDVTTVHVSLFPAEPMGMTGPLPTAKPGADGAFTLENVLPDKYTVQTNAPQGTYLASVAYGSSEILGKELDLSGGVGGELNVVFRYGAAEVDGSIKPTQQDGSAPQSAPSGQILLVPDALNADGTGVHFGSTDTSGSFSMKQIPPGHYRAYALEQMEAGAWQNPEFLKALEPKATDVQLKENDKLQIQLPLISSEDLRQIVAQAGLPAE